MEYIQNINNISQSNNTLYPQARYPEARVANYSNTNGSNYSNNVYNRSILNNNYTLDPIAKEISNNITRNYNNRIDNANKLNEALEIIRNSVMDEAEDEALYNMMVNQAMQDEDKEIIMDIANDVLVNIQRQIGGGIIYLDSENIENLKQFYVNEKFQQFGERFSDEDEQKYIQYMRFF